MSEKGQVGTDSLRPRSEGLPREGHKDSHCNSLNEIN